MHLHRQRQDWSDASLWLIDRPHPNPCLPATPEHYPLIPCCIHCYRLSFFIAQLRAHADSCDLRSEDWGSMAPLNQPRPHMRRCIASSMADEHA